jgi:hypothetical protein
MDRHSSLVKTVNTMLTSAALQLVGIDASTAIQVANIWQDNLGDRVIDIAEYSILPAAQPPTIEVVQANSAEWRETMTVMIQTGKTSPAELIRFALQHSGQAAPGRKMAEWSEIEAINLDYERNGHKYRTQEAFANKHHISKASFTRYRRLWKSVKI